MRASRAFLKDILANSLTPYKNNTSRYKRGTANAIPFLFIYVQTLRVLIEQAQLNALWLCALPDRRSMQKPLRDAVEENRRLLF